ncbi:MAG: DUF1700 domain-containing protein [Clostridia bacterium]|nr:DUF1700 domain-containing protein [Clostridia bacterium]
MNKKEFLSELQKALSGLPQDSIADRLNFYAEMIDDRMEDGLSEADAVRSLGTVENIARQVLEDLPLASIVRGRVAGRKKPGAGTVLLLCLGAPLWLPLLIAAAAAVISLYLSLWSIVVALWAVFAALAGTAFGGIAGGGVLLGLGHVPTGIALIGAALVCAGLSVFAFYGCKAATRGVIRLFTRAIGAIKKRLIKREGAK